MAKTQPVPAAKFTRNFGRYRMLAQKGAVPVSSHGKITGYFMAADEFEAFQRFKDQRRHFFTVDLPDEVVREIAESRMDPRHDHLNALMDDE